MRPTLPPHLTLPSILISKNICSSYVINLHCSYMYISHPDRIDTSSLFYLNTTQVLKLHAFMNLQTEPTLQAHSSLLQSLSNQL